MQFMDGIYGWIRNLTGFFLFMSVIDNLLPNKKYGRYVRLFSGMILILLVLQPLTGSLRLEDKIAHYYESFVFRYQADDLQNEILGIEKQRLEQMIAQYEHAVELDVGQMAEDMDFAVRECRVTINGEEGTEQFGTVTGISITVSAGAGDEAEQESGAVRGNVMQEKVKEEKEKLESGQQAIAPVEPVVIEPDSTIELSEPISDGYHKDRGQVSSQVGKLRRKIASYYSLEEAYVEIQVVEG